MSGGSTGMIETQNLKKYFPVKAGVIRDKIVGNVKALDGIDLRIGEKEIIGLVGESGSGKSTLAKVLLMLERPTSGKVFFQGKDVFLLGPHEVKAYQRSLQVVFQDPFSSLSPRLKVKEIIKEPLEVLRGIRGKEGDERAVEALRMVKLDSSIGKVFPHELSGGQRQRVAIARAIASEAKVIILDEPTSALDVSVRLQIVGLLLELQERLGLSFLLIGHDLALVAYMSTYIAVMYLGKIVEFAETKELVGNSLHPYTKALMSAALPSHPQEEKKRILLPGEIANPFNVPTGCRFHPRCLERKERCREIDPPLIQFRDKHWVACLE